MTKTDASSDTAARAAAADNALPDPARRESSDSTGGGVPGNGGETSGSKPDEVIEHRSRLMRGVFLLAGSVCVLLGVIGLFLPLLPTTPFLLLAAACYARSSRRVYDWLLANRTFGPLIHEWRKHRSIPYRTKLSAIGLMSATMAASIVFFVRPLWLQLVIAALGVALGIWMYRMPSRDRP